MFTNFSIKACSSPPWVSIPLKFTQIKVIKVEALLNMKIKHPKIYVVEC